MKKTSLFLAALLVSAASFAQTTQTKTASTSSQTTTSGTEQTSVKTHDMTTPSGQTKSMTMSKSHTMHKPVVHRTGHKKVTTVKKTATSSNM